jgi:hypothetical protein
MIFVDSTHLNVLKLLVLLDFFKSYITTRTSANEGA